MGLCRGTSGALIGRRWDEASQSWIDTPDEKWSIEPKIRAAANDLVQEAIKEGMSLGDLRDELSGLFSDDRALMIARTELGYAYNTGAAMNYAAQGVEYVMVRDGFGCLPEGHDDKAPAADSEVGLQEENQADGQIWPVQDALQYQLGHPNCVRAFLPATDQELEEAA